MTALSPAFVREIDALLKRRQSDAQSKAQASQSVTRQPEITDASLSPIARFNAAHRIEDLFIEYGYLENPSGGDWRSPHQQSGSYASRVFSNPDGSEHFVSFSESDAAAGVGKASSGGFIYGDAFNLYVHYEHKGNFAAALADWKSELAKLDADRRKAQRAENALIGQGSDTVPLTEMYTLDVMFERFVYINDGSQIADLTNPRRVFTLPEFRNALAGSKHQVTAPDGSTYTVAATKVWLEGKERLQADTITFHAGAGIMTCCPNGRQALNLWRPKIRPDVPDDWELKASIFIEHVRGLWGEDADPFLDWAAHIEQKPGELPHFGWLHVSPFHGTGRNWVSSVLARLWTGHVAASLDLVGLLEGSFNDRLSKCLLAIVDEVNEGGTQKYRTSNRLRQLVTSEVREINPKYGRKRVEHNAARWLIFSNHTGALPLDDKDRRFWVVSHDAQPRDALYYKRIYGLLHDPSFIASVAEFLRRRDISGFNPGQHPPMNEAKAALVNFSQSAEDAACKALVAKWPVDLMTASELSEKLPGYEPLNLHSTRHALDRAGIRKYTPKDKVRVNGNPERIYILRNHRNWSACTTEAIRVEIGRVTKSQKAAALNGCEDD